MNKDGNEEGVASKKFKFSFGKNDEVNRRRDKDILTAKEAQTQAGGYFLGPVIKKYVRAPVTQCLVRKKGTDDYFLMKTLILDDSNTADKCSFVRRTVFHNEYSILSLLKNCPGIIQVHDFFKDYIIPEGDVDLKKNSQLKRVCMVLECLIPHGHHNSELIPLNHYLKEDRLTEGEALTIFYNLLLVIEELHKRNIVHRDLKLSNVILNRKTFKVKLIDFYYAKLLSSDREVQYSQCRGSTCSSTDGLAGQGVYPKTCDMWSAGIILCAMLNGCMPFTGTSRSSNRSLREIYMKIMENDCTILNNLCISDGTKEILRSILCKIPQFRLKASEALEKVSNLLIAQLSSQNPSLSKESRNFDQIVPECPDFDSKNEEESKFPIDTKLHKEATKLPEEEEEGEEDKAKEKPNPSPKRCCDEEAERVPVCPSKNLLSNSGGGLLNSKEIKVAMMRLGVTSINSINALSFSYGKKRSCHVLYNVSQ